MGTRPHGAGAGDASDAATSPGLQSPAIMGGSSSSLDPSWGTAWNTLVLISETRFGVWPPELRRWVYRLNNHILKSPSLRSYKPVAQVQDVSTWSQAVKLFGHHALTPLGGT
jgi:hypothetical protein